MTTPTARFFAFTLLAVGFACRTSATSPEVVPAVRPTSVVPRPLELTESPGVFRFDRATTLTIEAPRSLGAEPGRAARLLADWLRAATGRDIEGTPGMTQARNSVVLTASRADHDLGEEGYALSVSPVRVLIRARGERGLLHAVQTLRQLAPAAVERAAQSPSQADAVAAFEWPCVEIRDRPRFGWRGMLLDCGRHFYSKAAVLRAIDLLAYHKLDVFHWHLTEDQGWRIAIERYPELVAIGAWRAGEHGRYGGFYTQNDVREVVAYAADRGVTVVPEIEMPGHALAALAARPELSCTGGPFEVGTRWGVYDDVYCAGNDATFTFLEDVIDEVVALFPALFVHIGGDECPKKRWEACARCQARIEAEGLKDEHELQSWFIRRIEAHLSKHGRRLIGWDEILEGGLAPGATVQSWRGMDGAVAAARQGHDVIASPTSHCYFDYPQSRDAEHPDWMGVIELEKVYAFEPIPPELSADEARHVLGVEGNVWTERIPEERFDVQAFPRLCALAEVGWSARGARDWTDFERRMRVHRERLDALGVRYFGSAEAGAAKR